MISIKNFFGSAKVGEMIGITKGKIGILDLLIPTSFERTNKAGSVFFKLLLKICIKNCTPKICILSLIMIRGDLNQGAKVLRKSKNFVFIILFCLICTSTL
jgi:hypothetical protein